MKRNIYILLLSALAFGYAAFSLVNMIGFNKTPGLLHCDGLLLDSNTVYAISNRPSAGPDTVLIRFRQARSFMPATLATIRFDRGGQQFIAVNTSDCLVKGTIDTLHPFRPFAHTYNAGIGRTGHYFEPGELISQKTLLDFGIKYNLPYGDRASRVKVLFKSTVFGIVMATKEQGLDLSYPLQRAKENVYGIYNNQKPEAAEAYVFAFDSLAKTPGRWQLHIVPGMFSVAYRITDAQGRQMAGGAGTDPVFRVGAYAFSVNYRYSLPFVGCCALCYLLLMAFQVMLFRQLSVAASPIVRALLLLRMLLNIAAWLAAPLFLASYYQVPGRLAYLFILLIFNVSVWFPKDYFQDKTIPRTRWLLVPAALLVAAAPFLFHYGTVNESLLGVIPMLHCQKAVILLLFYITQTPYFNRSRIHYFSRLGLILLYVFFVSLLTHDIGSFIYTCLAIGMIELVKKSLLFWHFAAVLGVLVLTMVAAFHISPGITGERKIYRLVAPYERADDPDLSQASEADRESFSILSLDLKNIQRLAEPTFNGLAVPASMRSTMHTDFAFHTSVLLGSVYFLVLYLVTTLMIARNVLLLLFCSTRECRINQRLSFNFPQSAEAEFARILLAITLVSFCYPVLSNLILIPVTGQSIPILSISLIEPVFLLILFVVLENIFNNQRYYAEKPSFAYTYTDMSKSLQWGMGFVCFSLLLILGVKNLQVFAAPEAYAWMVSRSTAPENLLPALPDGRAKAKLVRAAGHLLNQFSRPEDEEVRRLLLLNLSSLYYNGQPYHEINQAKNFMTSCNSLQRQMSVDSLRQERRREISGDAAPYGQVFAFGQQINGQRVFRVTQSYYATILPNSPSLNADLTAQLNEELARHLSEIGGMHNIGAVVIVDNRNGGIIANSSFPTDTSENANRHYYLIGSLKKMLVAYCALAIDPKYGNAIYGGKTFSQFLANSDDLYAASLLKEMLLNHRQAFSDILMKDFDLPLITTTSDGYLDAFPSARDLDGVLDHHNSIYRQSIGQQRPYQFIEVMQWYARLASHHKLILNYDGQYPGSVLSMPPAQDSLLKNCLHAVLTRGTAARVGQALAVQHINFNTCFAKTGTAESKGRTTNNSSSFILANPNYTIGVMLNGRLPANEKGQAAKDLFIRLLPVLIKYQVLVPEKVAAIAANRRRARR